MLFYSDDLEVLMLTTFFIIIKTLNAVIFFGTKTFTVLVQN